MKAVLCGVLLLVAACASPAADPRRGPEIWVNVRTIDLIGVDAQDRAAILELRVPLSAVQGGLVARQGLRPLDLTVGDLGSGVERRLEGSAIQALVETIAAYYRGQDRIGMRVEVATGDFERLLQGDTRLRLQIRNPPRASQAPPGAAGS